MDALTLAGRHIGVTAARKVEEQVALLERRGATTLCAPALSTDPYRIDEARLRAATEEVLAGPVDLLLGTTGVGVRAWFEGAREWGLLDALLAHLGRAEIVSRGAKTTGALRAHGLREDFVPASEAFADMLAHLDDRDLTGTRIVVQEHGQSLSVAADALRARGAEVVVVTVYRIAPPDDVAPLLGLVDEVVGRRLDAVTFTSAPAVGVLMDVADGAGGRDALVAAFRDGVVACCVGPVTGEAFEVWGVPTLQPERSRTAAMVRALESALGPVRP